MVANDNACFLAKPGALESIASKLAPTKSLRALIAAASAGAGGFPGLLLRVAPLRAGHEAFVVDHASAVKADIERLLMAGLSQFVVKALTGYDSPVGDRQGLAADLPDLLLGHAGIDFRDQRLVLVDRVGAAACQRG
ncbi:hypothetical protein D3C72_1972050 [compost metagenome]